LIVLGYQIFANIGHSDAKEIFKSLCATASWIGLSQEQLDALLEDVAESYAKDRGHSLLAAAFPKS